MPHATETLTNGDKPSNSSKFLSHLTSYPAVHDGIETYKANPYGKKSLELADGAYSRFGKPVEPYLEKPYGYAKPYVQKADELADSGLTKVEGHFPIVKEDTNTVIDTAKSYAFWPYNYLSNAWQDEYQKTAQHNNRGAGLTTLILALVSVQLRVASDALIVASQIVGPRYEKSKTKGADYVNIAKDNVNHFKDNASAELNHYANRGQQKANEAQKAGEEKAQQAKNEAKGAKEEVKKQANK